jgi:hypothetical protein
MLLEVAQHAADLFEVQAPHEKRRLLQFILSNSRWKDGDGELTVAYRQPFDKLVEAARDAKKEKAAEVRSAAVSAIWRGRRDSKPPLTTTQS